MWAERQKSPEVCKLLLRHGATPLQGPAACLSPQVLNGAIRSEGAANGEESPSDDKKRSNSLVFSLEHEDEMLSMQGIVNQMDLEDSYDVDWTIETTPFHAHDAGRNGVCLLPTESYELPEVAG